MNNVIKFPSRAAGFEVVGNNVAKRIIGIEGGIALKGDTTRTQSPLAIKSIATFLPSASSSQEIGSWLVNQVSSVTWPFDLGIFESSELIVPLPTFDGIDIRGKVSYKREEELKLINFLHIDPVPLEVLF